MHKPHSTPSIEYRQPTPAEPARPERHAQSTAAASGTQAQAPPQTPTANDISRNAGSYKDQVTEPAADGNRRNRRNHHQARNATTSRRMHNANAMIPRISDKLNR